MFELEILFEDQDLAVVIKPAGIVVNKADTVQERTVQDWWLERLETDKSVKGQTKKDWEFLVPSDFASEYGSPEEIFAERGGIVHRLDKETSGVMVLAKNPGSLAELLRQFRMREVQKTYLCLVHGKFQIPKGVISIPLGRSSQNRTQFTADVDGRTAETAYEVTQFWPLIASDQVMELARTKVAAGELSQPTGNAKISRKHIEQTYQGFSLVECQPKTGRTHQIRVHMKHIHHPIVSDPTYLGTRRQRLDQLWCPRLFLHAQELRFTHPRTKKIIDLKSALPTELQQALTFLQES